MRGNSKLTYKIEATIGIADVWIRDGMLLTEERLAELITEGLDRIVGGNSYAGEFTATVKIVNAPTDVQIRRVQESEDDE